MKLQKEIDLIEEFKSELDDYILDFDLEMDYLANQANFESTYKAQYQELLTDNINKKSEGDIFSRSEFKMPNFCQIGQIDINFIDEIGKIVDNSDFSMPLVVFNS